MKNLIKKALKILSVKVTVLNRKNELLQFGIHKANSRRLSDDNIYLEDFGFIINYKKHRFIIDGLRIMYDLKNKCNAHFIFDGNEGLIIEINNLKYYIQNYEEFFILNELFINGVYNVEVNKDFHLIDIGMNVAMTSIYFAQNPRCLSIIGFEPFKPTYRQALNNIDLNSAVKHKITPYNYGLGDTNTVIPVNYDAGLKGNMGINGIPEYLAKQSHNQTIQKITIKNSSEILLPLLNAIKQQGNDVVLKIDCEGSEYNIFKSFSASGILLFVNIIMMEWHTKGPDELTAILKEYGYQYFSFSPKNAMAGMIYAYRYNNN